MHLVFQFGVRQTNVGKPLVKLILTSVNEPLMGFVVLDL